MRTLTRCRGVALVLMTAALMLLVTGAVSADAISAQKFRLHMHVVRTHRATTSKRKKKKKTASHGARGPQGPAGPAGSTGPAGPAGPAGTTGPMGPGAIKVNFFEAPSPGDGVHNALNVGPLQIGISCKGTTTGNTEIELGSFITIPGPQTLLSELASEPTKSPGYVNITGSITDSGGESKVAAKEAVTESATFIVAGADGVPHWLWLAYGATTEEKSTTNSGLTEVYQRGCWLLAEEI